jgi:hypothetical protein
MPIFVRDDVLADQQRLELTRWPDEAGNVACPMRRASVNLVELEVRGHIDKPPGLILGPRRLEHRQLSRAEASPPEVSWGAICQAGAQIFGTGSARNGDLASRSCCPSRKFSALNGSVSDAHIGGEANLGLSRHRTVCAGPDVDDLA